MRFIQIVAVIAIIVLAASLGWRFYQVENSPREPLPALTLEPVRDLPGFEGLATGEPALLHIWGAGCAECQAEHILLLALRDEGISIFGISTDEYASDTAAFLVDRGNPFAGIMRDVEGQSAQALMIETFPTTIILSAEGEILRRIDGPMDVATLRNQVYPLIEREMRR